MIQKSRQFWNLFYILKMILCHSDDSVPWNPWYDLRPWAWGRDSIEIHISPSYLTSLNGSLCILKLVIFLQLLTDHRFASATPTTATVPKATAVPSHTTLISFSGKNSRGGLLHLACCGPYPDQTDPDQSVLRIHDILVWIRIWIRGSMPLTNGSGSGLGSGSNKMCPGPRVF